MRTGRHTPISITGGQLLPLLCCLLQQAPGAAPAAADDPAFHGDPEIQQQLADRGVSLDRRVIKIPLPPPTHHRAPRPACTRSAAES